MKRNSTKRNNSKRRNAKRLLLLATIALISAMPALPAFAGGNDKLANIPTSEYAARRQKLLSQIKDSVVVVMVRVKKTLVRSDASASVTILCTSPEFRLPRLI
jgi:hypothetical protein